MTLQMQRDSFVYLSTRAVSLICTVSIRNKTKPEEHINLRVFQEYLRELERVEIDVQTECIKTFQLCEKMLKRNHHIYYEMQQSKRIRNSDLTKH